MEYRVREEEYDCGKSKFYPEVSIDDTDTWKILSLSSFGFNDNGLDHCTTYDDAVSIINNFKMSLIHQNCKVSKEKIHKIN